ncbi:MAG: uroporphyrinogen decarboxylase family protein [Candidatus Latescibacterota bacterium]
MPLTSRQIVQESLAFACPPRIPYAMGGGFPSDFRGVGRKPAPNRLQQPWTQRDGHWDMVDEWGNQWRRLEAITKGEVHRGAIEEGWHLLETYQWPDVDRADLYEEAAERVKQYHGEGCYVQGGMGMSFDIARYMRRMEVFLADCAAEPARVQALLERLAGMLEQQVHRYADIGVDGISTGEDWGTQDRLLMSPRMFRRLFKPVYQRVVGAARSRGLSFRLHSCGFVREIIPDWIETGVDILQFDQPELHSIDYLATHFGGRVHFECPVDIQTTLQTRDHGRIRNAAQEYIDKLASPFGGGFIAGYYGSNEALGLDPQYQETAARTFMERGESPWRGAAGRA